MGHGLSSFELDSDIENFVRAINVFEFKADISYDDDDESKNRAFNFPATDNVSTGSEIEDDYEFDVKFPAFKANAKIRIPPIPSGQRWAFGFIQGLWNSRSKIYYGDQGYLESIFPFTNGKEPTMIADTNGPFFPFNGTDVYYFENSTKTSLEFVINMYDKPSTHIEWCSPADEDKNSKSFTEFKRELKFSTWLVALDLNHNNFFGLRCATWGTSAHIFADSEGYIHKDDVKNKLYRIPPCILFPLAANAVNFEVWKSYKRADYDDALMNSPLIKLVSRFED